MNSLTNNGKSWRGGRGSNPSTDYINQGITTLFLPTCAGVVQENEHPWHADPPWKWQPYHVYLEVTEQYKKEFKNKNHRRKTFVYFIFAKDVRKYKIGTTINLKQRFSELKLCSPVILSLVLLLKGNEKLERFLHACFRDNRHIGEWFFKTSRMEELIKFLKEGQHRIYKERVQKINDTIFKYF